MPGLTLFKSDGTQSRPTRSRRPSLSYTLQPGDESTYHFRVTGSAGRGLMAEYFLDLGHQRHRAAVDCRLHPAQRLVQRGMIGSFSLSFNKDMLASTVNNASNYALVWAGADDEFSTADDAGHRCGARQLCVRPVQFSYAITNAPLLPGNYRFTATVGLRDKFGNRLRCPSSATSR